MEENIVLAGFVALVALAANGVRLFFRKYKLHRRPRALNLLLGNSLVCVLLMAVILLTGEFYYRFVYDTTESFGLSRTTQRWFDRHFRRNSLGFRDSIEYPGSIEAGTRRVTFLGDSFTAGHGIANVEDRFVNIVREQLPDYDVQSFSMCAWDTPQEISCLKMAGDAGHEFDTVVLVYCLNDISDISPEWQSVLKRIQEFSDPGFVVENSYLFNTIYYRWKAFHDPDIGDYYQFVRDLYEGRTWEIQSERLVRLHDLVTQRGGRLIVVTFPFLHALSSNYRYGPIHKQLDRFWQQRDVPHLDLLSVLQEFEPKDVVVSQFDAHPNEHAHSVAAEAIVELLSSEIPRAVDGAP
ncbi:MAG TPA: SGNH/GDSL hydrolase family protein [Planctomycetes bacterium]|nr:SGNH/GDSL hydrolase family protein [Fuerstiella sp.]HIK95618.1 SGNH/GDSL hydrolase family protein [Planctomycetota bacterium]